VPDNCPHCGTNLIGQAISKESQVYYGNATHYRREIGVEIRGVYDGVLFWECPECGHAWHRFPETDYRHAKAQEYMDSRRGARRGA
jgi:predicted RNA-binding Zn-ribbon protein involved in translation (DUF1610 family)